MIRPQFLKPSLTGFDFSNTNLRFSGLDGVRYFFISVFEWFGELGIFCGRLARAALAPLYEFIELLRQLACTCRQIPAPKIWANPFVISDAVSPLVSPIFVLCGCRKAT